MAKDYTRELDETIRGDIDQDTLNQLIQITIASINTAVTWEHFDNYIKSKIAANDPLNDFLFTHILLTLYKAVRNHKKYQSYSILFFDNPQSARAFEQFINHIAPTRNPEYPKLSDKLVYISSDQNHFINRTAMLKEGALPVEFFKDCYLKTLRSDIFDFTSTFLTTLFKTNLENRALQNLRPTNRGAYIICPGGIVVKRHERESNLGSNKNGFTQIQSVTYIDDWLLSRAFGHSHRETLFGLVTHQDDLRISRLLERDSGTITRPFETNNEPVDGIDFAGLFHHKRAGHYSVQQLTEFKRTVCSEKSKDFLTNEVLARIRFNPDNSFVAICSNTLNSRLLADDFSQELLEYLERDLSIIGLKLNPNFKLPITFYSKPPVKTKSFFDRLSDSINQHQLALYTCDMRLRDIQQCNEIFTDKEKRHKHYRQHDFDFLLGINILNIDILTEEIDNVPLAIFVLKQGYARVLTRLLRPSRLKRQPLTDPNLLINLFNYLLDRNHIKQNDPIISELIRIEAFELAEMLINRTNSDKTQLILRTLNLVDYLAEKGNPRQLMFMGLSEMLRKAAAKKQWVAVRLCLKEIKKLDKTLLEDLFLEACKQDQHSEIILLNKILEVNNNLINQVFALKANDSKINTTTIRLLIKLYPNLNNHPELGRVLLSALRLKECELARVLFKIVKSQRSRNGDTGKVILESTLLLAIKHSLNDMLSDALEHEKSCDDAFSERRLQLAFDLAKQKNNTAAIALLTDNASSNTSIDPADPIKSVCILVFEAYIIGEIGLAQWRLFHYGHEIDIIPQDSDKKFTYGFKILLTAFERALPFLPFDSAEQAHKLAAKLLTLYRSPDLYLSTRALINSKLKPASENTERKIASILIDALNPIGSNGLLFPKHIKAVISQSDHLHIWLDILGNKLIDIPIKSVQKKLKNFNEMGEFKDDNVDQEIEELFEIGIFTLDLVNTKNAFDIDNNIMILINLMLGVNSLFSSSYSRKNNKVLQAMLSIPFVIEKFADDILSTMVDIALGGKVYDVKKTDEDYFSEILTRYPFKTKHKHLETALKYTHQWIIIPLVKKLDDEDIRNPSSFWAYFELWRKFKLSMIVRPKDQSESLAFKLGPIRARHYTLLTVIIALCKIFEDIILSSSFIHLIRLFKNEATMKILKDCTTEVKDTNDHLLHTFKPVLQLLNDYLSNLETLETLPDDQTVLYAYQNLLTVFEGMISHPSPHFFNKKEEQGIITEFLSMLLQIDEIFNPTPIKDDPEPHSKPDPSDIVFYL